ncbi:MAG: hypothetical protein ACJATT_003587 [Myxococcota bacterium]
MTIYDDMWSQTFGELPLVACELRVLLPDRWVRFDSLPESKRYADNQVEYAEVLRRQNQLVDELLCGKPGWMVTAGTPPDQFTDLTELSAAAARAVVADIAAQADLADRADLEFLSSLLGTAPTRLTRDYRPAHHEPDSPVRLLHGWPLRWQPGMLDAWLRLIADDERFNTLILDAEFKRLIAPYDGGVDVIVATQEERDQLRQRHVDWLSPHPCGTGFIACTER